MLRLQRIRDFLPFLAIIAFYIYLIFHMFRGSQGLVQWVNHKQDLDRLSVVQKEITAEQERLELYAASLRSTGLDIDRLEQRARKILYVSHPNDITIWLDVGQ